MEYLGYIGGFDPGMVVYNYTYFGFRGKHKFKVLLGLLRRKHFIMPFLILLERLFRVSPNFFTKFNAPFCSHMLLGIFRAPNDIR